MSMSQLAVRLGKIFIELVTVTVATELVRSLFTPKPEVVYRTRFRYTRLDNKPTLEEEAQGELFRAMRLFCSRMASGSKLFSKKDILFSLCSDLSDICGKVPHDVRAMVKAFLKFVEDAHEENINPSIIADELYKQISALPIMCIRDAA